MGWFGSWWDDYCVLFDVDCIFFFGVDFDLLLVGGVVDVVSGGDDGGDVR